MHITLQIDRETDRKLDLIIAMLTAVLQKETKIMSDIGDVLTKAEAAAAANSSAEDAVEALLLTLSQEILDLKNAAVGTDPTIVARIQTLSDTLNAKAAQLAAAVVANTPAPPAPAPVPPVTPSS